MGNLIGAKKAHKKQRRSGLMVSSVTALMIAGCNYSQTKGAPEGAQSAQSLGSFAAIKTNILDAKCARCHSGVSPDGGVDLSNYNSILANPGLVTKGDPAGSRIYSEVESGGMPEGGPALSAEEVKSIGDWIIAGAPDADFASPAATLIEPALAPELAQLLANSTGTIRYADIQTKIFDQACVRCHSGTKPRGSVDLTSFAELMKSGNLVVPGDAQKSLVFTEIESASMPPKGPAIDPVLVQQLATWINEGAKNE